MTLLLLSPYPGDLGQTFGVSGLREAMGHSIACARREQHTLARSIKGMLA